MQFKLRILQYFDGIFSGTSSLFQVSEQVEV
jgi:hypothetical protein